MPNPIIRPKQGNMYLLLPTLCIILRTALGLHLQEAVIMTMLSTHALYSTQYSPVVYINWFDKTVAYEA